MIDWLKKYIYFYVRQTETSAARSRFLDSINHLLSEYNFDGIDLAWQFPPVNEEKHHGPIGSLLHGFRNRIGFGEFKDDKVNEHREGFTTLVRDLKALLSREHKELTLTILPHIDARGKFIVDILFGRRFVLNKKNSYEMAPLF